MTKMTKIEKVDAFFNVNQDGKKEKGNKGEYDGFYMIVEIVRPRCPFNPFAEFIDDKRTYFIKVAEFDNISDTDAKDGMECMSEKFKDKYFTLAAAQTRSIRREDNTWYHEARASFFGAVDQNIDMVRAFIRNIVGTEKTQDTWMSYVTLGTFDNIDDAREVADALNQAKSHSCKVISFTTKRPTA